MRLMPSKLDGVVLIEPEPHRDDRGFFCEAFNRRKLLEHGIDFPVEQVNVSMSLRAGTVRGMHYQADPHGQQKLVRCLSGDILDVIVDLRPESPTYRKHASFRLHAGDFKTVYVPLGCAHGYQALKDFSEIQYVVSGPWNREAERGIQPTDPAAGIKWSLPVVGLNQRDATWPLLEA